MTYKDWMNQVDALLNARIGFTHLDLPDQMWHDIYDSGADPEEALEELFGEYDPMDEGATFMRNAIMGGE